MKAILAVILILGCYYCYADDLGAKTYNMACSNCHSPKLASSIGAPPAFVNKEWRKRYKEAKLACKEHPEKYKSATDYFLQQVKKGKGLMHHGGLCNESQHKEKDCSDEALIAAIKYMSGY